MNAVAKPVRSKREALEADLDRAKADVRECEVALDDAEEAVCEIEAELKALDDAPEPAEEAPLRVVDPAMVKAGWSLDISANALAERERALSPKAEVSK